MPTVRLPTRMARRGLPPIATETISVTSVVTLSPGITDSAVIVSPNGPAREGAKSAVRLDAR